MKTLNNKKQHLMRTGAVLLFALLTSATTWAQILSGSGTAADPFLIQNDADWETFANMIKTNNNLYAGKCYKLTADINASTIVASETYKSFHGTFIGDGHTITMNLNTDEEYTGLFRYVYDASFNTLHIAGSITTSQKNCGGLIGYVTGSQVSVSISNCWSSVTINSSYNSYYPDNGGFVGYKTGNVVLTNCLFDGKFLGNTKACAGLIGNGYSSSDQIMRNCLVALSEIPAVTSDCSTFIVSSNPYKIYNSYYTQTLGKAQGTAVGDMTNEQLKEALGPGWVIDNNKVVPVLNPNDISVADVSGMPSLYYEWTGNPIDVTYTVKDAYGRILTNGTDFTASISPEPVQNIGVYTLTLTGVSSYTGTKVIPFEVHRNLSGRGLNGDPYMINSDEDWEAFVYWINEQNDKYTYREYKLGADINVTTMVGVDENTSFRGKFDGNGHTITVNLTSDDDYCAPFRFVRNGTFKRMHVTGSITTSKKYAGGIVGHGSTQITGNSISFTNCLSSVTINGTSTGSSYYGGFVGYSKCRTNFNNCCFKGSILASSSQSCRGFVGYFNSEKAYITNCLFNPTEINVDTKYGYTFSNTLNISNSYYTQSLGKAQGVDASSMSNEQLLEALGPQWTIVNNEVLPVLDINNLSTGSLECAVFIPYESGTEINVSFTVKNMDGKVVDAANYDVTFTPSPVIDCGNYSMTVTGKTANGYSGTLTHVFTVAEQLPGSGTASSPYTISNADQWNQFAVAVAGGYSYNGEYVQLSDDIEISTMVGVYGNCPFSGTFDGANHTLTTNIVSTAAGNTINEQGVAPFHYINGATIKNLFVTGSVTSANKYTGGLVGWSSNSSHINDCVVTTVINTGNNYAGGFVGNISPEDKSYSIFFENCVFAGTINNTNYDSETDRKAGGFFGSGGGYSYFTNCLENGTYINVSAMSPRSAYNSFYNNSVTSLYYVNKFGDVGSYITAENGCCQVYLANPQSEIYMERSVKGYSVYQPAIAYNLYTAYAYDNGNTVNLGYTLKMGKTAMTLNTDFEESISPAQPSEIGEYTITLSAKDGNAAGYAGSVTYPFRIMEGESLDGYVFAKDGDDYLINDAGDLERLAAYVNSNTKHTAQGITFKLNADIDLTGVEHTPIGGYYNGNSYNFSGTFDGNNKTISNLVINRPDGKYLGLFGRINNNALIKDIRVIGASITGKYNVGGIVGSMIGSSSNSRCTIQNCHFSGTVAATTMDNASCHGGIVGYCSYGDISGCTVTGTISTIYPSNDYGGIAGEVSTGSITSCESSADIEGPGYYHGGIAGNISSLTMSLCLNTGLVEGTTYVGRLTGNYASYNTCTDCYYVGSGELKSFGSDKGSNNYVGKGEPVYTITAGESINTIALVESESISSILTGKTFYKNGDWTLTMTPDLNNSTFVKYGCEGATLTDLFVQNGNHTLTIANHDATICAVVSSTSGTDITSAVVNIPDQRWRGTVEVTPTVVVMSNDTQLIEDTDYIVTFSNNIDRGSATANVIGINNYKGVKEVSFNIVDFPLLDPTAGNSSTNPYLIATEDDIIALAGIVNAGIRNNGYYKQTANITLTSEHTAIGKSGCPFKGSYDGDNKTISGLYINKPHIDYQGLFGYANAATIKNVIIVGCDITGAENTGGVVGLLGNGSSMVKNCKVSGAIKVLSGRTYAYHGGIVGYFANGRVEDCVNTATVTGDGNYRGGIAGYMSYGGILQLYDCFNAGVVEGTAFVGSIVGGISSSYNSNALDAARNYHTWSTTGGIGAGGVSYGTDQTDYAEVVVEITANTGVTLELPTPATYIWNGKNLYKNGTDATMDCVLPIFSDFGGYTVNEGIIDNANVKDGTHTLSGFSKNVVISYTYSCNTVILSESDGVDNDMAVNIKGRNVSFERSFTENVASTICLPFGVTASQSWGKFYEFAGISRPGNANWTVTMQEHSTNDLTANTPYLFVPASTGSIEFSGDVPDDFDGNPGSVSAVDNVYGGTWSFRGTYKGIQWNAGDADLGYVFGFASAGYDGGAYTVSPGDFVRASSGASIASFRAYLKFNAPQHAPARNGSVISSDRQMPSRLTVVLLGKDGGTTAVGTLDTTTGTFTFDEDAWYSIDGHKLESQPTAPGVYINGTRKVTIKY